MDELDDRVIGDAIAGDRHALSALWCGHRGWLTGVVLSCGPNGADVEDIMQEVGMAVVQRIHTLRDPRALRAWLRQVARGVAVDAVRRRVRDQDVKRATPVAGGAAHARIDALLALVGGLPEHYREPLLLRARGMAPGVIAEVLDVPVRTVETRLQRARAMLRDQAMRASEHAEVSP